MGTVCLDRGGRRRHLECRKFAERSTLRENANEWASVALQSRTTSGPHDQSNDPPSHRAYIRYSSHDPHLRDCKTHFYIAVVIDCINSDDFTPKPGLLNLILFQQCWLLNPKLHVHRSTLLRTNLSLWFRGHPNASPKLPTNCLQTNRCGAGLSH